jgi:hypothetical protein
VNSVYCWAHLSCGLWLTLDHEMTLTPELVFDFTSFPYDSCMSACEFCGSTLLLTPKYQCKYGKCTKAFHPECLRARGYKLMDLLTCNEESAYSLKRSDLPSLYCKRHQLALKTEEEAGERAERQRDLAMFARNVELCVEVMLKNQEKELRDLMGPQEYARVYLSGEQLPKKPPRAHYYKDKDCGTLVRQVFSQFYRVLGVARLEWKSVRTHQTCALVSSSGFSFKNLNGEQALKEFKRLLPDQPKFDLVQPLCLSACDDEEIARVLLADEILTCGIKRVNNPEEEAVPKEMCQKRVKICQSEEKKGSSVVRTAYP